MLEVRATTRFKKEVKKAARQQKEMQRLGAAIDLLQAEELLPERNLDHALQAIIWGIENATCLRIGC